MSLLEIDRLSVSFDRRHAHRVLSGVSLSVAAGEILGVIGETGSGKTTLARAVVGLAPVESGRISFAGTDVTALRGRALRTFRRTGAVQFMFQDPLRALDPQQTVAAIVAEGLAATGDHPREEIADRVAEALRSVGLDGSLHGRRPGQLSGGQRQRVLLARAIVLRPRLLICDEPVSALDASNRNHVLKLLSGLRTELAMTVVVISHDLSSLAGIADRVAVLYGGRIVEQGPIGEVLTDPRHPYSALLTASAPSVRREHRLVPGQLRPAPGDPPWPGGAGCVFAGRCRFATGACRVEPPTRDLPGDRRVACHHAETWRADLHPASPPAPTRRAEHAVHP